MARAGLRALEFYDPVNKKHGQAHMQARHVFQGSLTATLSNVTFRLGITQHLIRSGIARLEEVCDSSGALVNMYVRVSQISSVANPLVSTHRFFRGFFSDNQIDRNLVLTKGREVAGKLLVELQVRKSTADGHGARSFYTELTKPIDGWEGRIRDLVLAKKQV
jgi:dipeptidyl-peptidase-3